MSATENADSPHPEACPHEPQQTPPARWSALLFAVLAVGYIVLIPLPRADNHLLGSDGGYYYAYMRSFWLDRDVDITNDIALYNSRMTPDNPNRLRILYDRSIGPAVLWSPFFLPARGLTLLLSKAGVPIATDGFSYLEEAAACLGSIAYAVLGLHLLFLAVSRHVGARAAAGAVMLIFGSTFAFYYTLFEPSMGHALELFTVSLFAWSVLGRDTGTARAWIVTGLAGGLMTLVRWQNGVFLLLVPYGLMQAEATLSRRLTHGFIAVGALLAVTAIQAVFWQACFGVALTVPQGGSFMTPLDLHMREVLFSTRHGLLSWHPVFAVATIGLCFVRPRRLALMFCLLILLQLYVCSMVSEWWCADSFGMRRMTGTIPMFSFGLAFLLARAGGLNRARRRVLAGVAIALVAWNVLFMAQYRLGTIPPGEALSARQMTLGKLQVFSEGYAYLTRLMNAQ